MSEEPGEYVIRRETGFRSLPDDAFGGSLRGQPALGALLADLRHRSPGMYGFLEACSARDLFLVQSLWIFVLRPWREQMAELGFEPRKSVRRLLAKLIIPEGVDPERLHVLQSWLNSRDPLPKPLLHAEVVYLAYMEALMRESWLEEVASVKRLGLDCSSNHDMHRLRATVGKLVMRAHAYEMDAAWLRQVLRSGMRFSELEMLCRDLDRRLWRSERLQRGTRVEPPFQPGRRIWAPRTLEDFDWLGEVQNNCIADYFVAARLGQCAIYAVCLQGEITMTAEVVPLGGGLWVPMKMLGKSNSEPEEHSVHILVSWLALVQGNGWESDTAFQQNLDRIRGVIRVAERWACPVPRVGA